MLGELPICFENVLGSLAEPATRTEAIGKKEVQADSGEEERKHSLQGMMTLTGGQG